MLALMVAGGRAGTGPRPFIVDAEICSAAGVHFEAGADFPGCFALGGGVCGTTPRTGVRRSRWRARELAVDAAASRSDRAVLAAAIAGTAAAALLALATPLSAFARCF